MADSTNNISIQVIDGVSPEIAPKLIRIATASDQAAVSVGNLADQMATLKGAGLGSLSTMLTKLETSTLKAAVAQTTLNARIAATTNTTYQLANAQGTVSAALQATTQASRANQNASLGAAAGTTAQAGATNKLVSANISAAAGLGILEGRTLSMNRAAANFLTRILGLGPALQSAFVVIGAAALVAVLYQMGESLTKVIKASLDAASNIGKAFDGIIDPLRKTNDELAVTNDKLDNTIARLLHKPSSNGLVLALDEARLMADRLDDSLEHVQNELDGILKKNQVNPIMAMITGQAGTSAVTDKLQAQEDSIARIRESVNDANLAARANGPAAALKAETDGYNTLREAIKKVASERIADYNALKMQPPTTVYSASGAASAIGDSQTANLTELGKAAHLAQYELESLDLTQSNLTKNATADKLKDQLTGERLAVKAAAEQWKELESAYKHFQETQAAMGHKTTPTENLDALNSLGSHLNNPLNADKLAALKLPQQNKLDENSAWVKDEQDRLAALVGELGLYGDALKEASMMKTIQMQAEKKGVVLTADQTAGLKAQIAGIVETAEYQKALQSVYESVTRAQDEYNARTLALQTVLSAQGVTQERINLAISQTTHEFNKATDAVAAFQFKLDDQMRDAGNKLGSNLDIAAKAELQTLADNMRKTNIARPGTFSESDITAQVNAMRQQVAAQQMANDVNQAANKIIFEQTNLLNQAAIAARANAIAVKAGAESQQAANSANLVAWTQQNNQKLTSGTGGDPFKGAVAEYAKDFTTLAAGIQTAFKPVFKTLADGFADSIGRAIVYSKNLGAALKDVARSAIAELISGLIKLGLQYIINLAMGTAAATAATALTVAAAGAASAAWAAPATLASIATLGAADEIGAQALATTLIAGQMMALVAPKLATGTNSLPSDMLVYAHANERIIPAADNKALLAAVDNGTQSGGKMNVQVHNYSGAHVTTQQMDDNTVRLIVRDEAPSLIAQHAPGVIAGDLANPNSRTSKAMTRNTFTTRRR